MKKKITTSTFSVRTDNVLLDNFDKLIENSSSNRNKILNDFILEYVTLNSSHYDADHIQIQDNIEQLGYKKEFFTRKDAEFFIRAENILNNTQKELFDENDVLRVLHTGVKYSFTKIGLRIYSTWYFNQSTEKSTVKHDLFLGNVQIIYDEKDDSVEYLTQDTLSEPFTFNQ